MTTNQADHDDEREPNDCKANKDLTDPIAQLITQSSGLSDKEKQQFIKEATQSLDNF